MRIAFVGKGGSGKTTMAAFFSQFLGNRVLSVDADINVHLSELLLGRNFPKDKFLSSVGSSSKIKKYLLGMNTMENLEEFRKTTPPNFNSNLVYVDPENPLVKEFAVDNENVSVMAVGTYESEGIGVSCYHNNLAILENLLTHLIDRENVVIVDMAAGVDAFASSLHIQFDIIVLVVEPTRKSLEVFRHYEELAKSAGINEDIFVVGNKISSKADEDFLVENIPLDKLLGFVSDSDYVKEHDKAGGVIDFNKLDSGDREILTRIFETLNGKVKEPNERLKKIHALHEKYVSQPFIKERFGDLTKQIDPDFKYE